MNNDSKVTLVRLQKVIAMSGLVSRRMAEKMITEGRVKVNGLVVTELGTKVSDADVIEVDEKMLQKDNGSTYERKVYYVLKTPVGVITSVKDPQGRKTVRDLLSGVKERIYPVGRLDYETSGILLLTNDGDLAYRLTHPKFGVFKTYLVQTERIIPQAAIEQLEKGVLLEDGMTAPAKVEKVSNEIKKCCTVNITIHEGRNRQIRRMFDKIGYPVQKLQRIKFGPLEIGTLPVGKYRKLNAGEIERLKAEAGISSGKEQN